MAQITNGWRSLLSSPKIYDGLQTLMGARKSRAAFSKNFIRAKNGDHVLDLGCGTADYLAYLPDVQYFGVDASPAYIEAAKSRFSTRGRFECRLLGVNDLKNLPEFDIVLTAGVLHHLDDDNAMNLLRTAYSALKPGGRFISIDPCHTNDQNIIARILVNLDRGQNVRAPGEYEQLAKSIFKKIIVHTKHQTWIPYTHCIVECIR